MASAQHPASLPTWLGPAGGAFAMLLALPGAIAAERLTLPAVPWDAASEDGPRPYSALPPSEWNSGVRSVPADPPAELAPQDQHFVDQHSGKGWGNRCYNHIKTGRLDWATAACEHGLALNPDTWTRGALLYNMGLIAEQSGDPDRARRVYSQSLAVRPTGPGSQTVRDKLAALQPAPSTGTSPPSAADAPVDMVLVPAGTFTMGSDDGKDSEKPARLVTISKAFFIDRTEVTSGAYQRCVGSSRCTATSIHGPAANAKSIDEQSSFCTGGDSMRSNYPINCIDRGQAETYCQFVGKRLPTEAEWEYAARGQDRRTYPWGEAAPVGCDFAVTAGCIRHLGEVGTRPKGASPFGAHDMAGSVWEWVSDGWSDAPATAGTTDPFVPPTQFLGVLRGGAWDVSASFSRGSSRYKFTAGSGHVSSGVRCACDIGVTPTPPAGSLMDPPSATVAPPPVTRLPDLEAAAPGPGGWATGAGEKVLYLDIRKQGGWKGLWREGRVVVGRFDLPASMAEAAERIRAEWEARGSHRAASDDKVDRAVILVGPGVATADLAQAATALTLPKRQRQVGAGLQLISAFEVSAAQADDPALKPTQWEPPNVDTFAGPEPKTVLDSPMVSGRLAQGAIQERLQTNLDRVSRCYRGALVRNPALAGKVATRFVIDLEGRVHNVQNGGSDLPDSVAVTCILGSHRELRFPEPPGGITTVVTTVNLSPGP